MYIAEDLMTSDPVAVREAATVREAVHTFRVNDTRHLPVVNADHEMVGMLSDRDLRGLAFPEVVDGEWIGIIQAALEAPIATVMSSNALSVRSDAEASEIVEIMLDHKIGAVPVVDADGKLVGIVSYVDVLRMLPCDDSVADAAQ